MYHVPSGGGCISGPLSGEVYPHSEPQKRRYAPYCNAFLFQAAAAGLIFVGVWVYTEYRHYEQMGEATYTLIPATIIMALGVFFFILGLVGCVGAFKEQRCMLGVVRLKSLTIGLKILCVRAR